MFHLHSTYLHSVHQLMQQLIHHLLQRFRSTYPTTKYSATQRPTTHILVHFIIHSTDMYQNDQTYATAGYIRLRNLASSDHSCLRPSPALSWQARWQAPRISAVRPPVSFWFQRKRLTATFFHPNRIFFSNNMVYTYTLQRSGSVQCTHTVRHQKMALFVTDTLTTIDLQRKSALPKRSSSHPLLYIDGI